MTCTVKSKYGRLIFPVFSFIFLIIISLTSSLAAEKISKTAPKNELIDRAMELVLYKDPYWWTLLHYKKGFWGVKSLIDDPAFFLAKKGKTDPKAELKAFIETFFLKVPEEKRDICHFVARYKWVREKLCLSETEYPEIFCDKAELIEPSSATIVFPTYFLNNPASMFGHTFLNISTDYSSKILSNAVNYSAYTGEPNGCFYTFNGIFGLFKGYYSILPYYKKIQEYSDMDQRDMWEYSLNLNREELKRLLFHVLEMEKIYSDYYFFDENCSYNLMFLLEAARPGVNLTDKFGPWVVPIDTIKAMKEEGLIVSVSHRPSIVTDIKMQMAQLPEKAVDTAILLAEGKIVYDEKKNDKEIEARTYDLAADITKYRYIKREISKKKYSRQLISILKKRSRLRIKNKEDYKKNKFRDPSRSHETSRISIGEGWRKGHFYQEIKIRPAFTDLLSSDYRKDIGIHLQLLNAEFRYYHTTELTQLEHFDFFNAVSLTPGDRFFKPFSWKVSTGARRKLIESGRKKLVSYLKAGIGVSRYNDSFGIIYGFPLIQFDASAHLENNFHSGAGIEIGMLKQWSPSFKSYIKWESIFFDKGNMFHEHDLSTTFYGSLCPSIAIGLEGKLYREGEKNGDEIKLFLDWFF